MRRNAGHVSPILAGLCVVLSATACLAAGPRVLFHRDASGFSARIENMTAAEVVREMGVHFGFRVTDRAPSGPLLNRSLRAPSVVGLVRQLLPAGGYALVYRRDGPDGAQVVDAVLLVPPAPAGDFDGRHLPERTDRGSPPTERLSVGVPSRSEHGVAPADPVPPTAAADPAPRSLWSEKTSGGPAADNAVARGPASRPSPSPPTPPAREIAPFITATAPSEPPVIPDEVRRFIAERVDIMVDIAREATLSGSGGR